jgi:hypothetical protein
MYYKLAFIVTEVGEAILMAGGLCPARYAGKKRSLRDILTDVPATAPENQSGPRQYVILMHYT